MCSGNGSNFENIVHSCPDHDVVIMVYNKKKCKARKRADRLDVPAVYSKDEDDIIKIFEAYPGQIINLHPSLLPKYKVLYAVEKALKNGDEVTGCTVHFVTEELDSGKIIKQQEVPILPGDTVESLQRAIQQAEHHLLPLVINAL